MADERKVAGKRDHAHVSGGAGGDDEPPRRDKPPSLSKTAEDLVSDLRKEKPTKEEAGVQHILLDRTPGSTRATVDVDSVFAAEGRLPRRSLDIHPFMEGTLSTSSSTTTTSTERVVQSTARGTAALTSTSTTTTVTTGRAVQSTARGTAALTSTSTTTTRRSSARGTAALTTSSTSPAKPKPDQQSDGESDDEENTKG